MRDGKLGVLHHRVGVLNSVLIEHSLEIHIRIAVEHAGEVLIVIALFLGDIVQGNIVSEILGDILCYFHRNGVALCTRYQLGVTEKFVSLEASLEASLKAYLETL